MGRPVGTEPARRTSIPRVVLAVVVVTVLGSWLVGHASDEGGELRTAPVDEQSAVRSTTSTSAPAQRSTQRSTQRGTPRRGASGAEAFPLDAVPEAVAPASTAPPTTTPPIVPRPVPPELPPQAPPTGTGPPWAASTRTTPAGYVATDVGCASGNSAGALDAFFRDRIGPVLGHDYQHVYDLGGDRRLWLFQDTFVDQGGTATRLDRAAFVHNAAMLQEGSCFTLLHRGTSCRADILRARHR